MPGKFKTYGPFELSRTAGMFDSACLKKMWSDEASRPKGLRNAIGVYVIGFQVGSDVPTPFYVGKTDKGFDSRFKQHLSDKTSLFSSDKIPNDVKMLIFLITLHTPSGAFRKPARAGRILMIQALEFMLIGTCVTINDDLHNTSHSTVHRALQVPGYWNDAALKRDHSSNQLAAMLRVDKSTA